MLLYVHAINSVFFNKYQNWTESTKTEFPWYWFLKGTYQYLFFDKPNLYENRGTDVCEHGGPSHPAPGVGAGAAAQVSPALVRRPSAPHLYSTRSHSGLRSLDLTRCILGTMAAWLGSGTPRAPASVAPGLDVLPQHDVTVRWQCAGLVRLCLLASVAASLDMVAWPVATRLALPSPCPLHRHPCSHASISTSLNLLQLKRLKSRFRPASCDARPALPHKKKESARLHPALSSTPPGSLFRTKKRKVPTSSTNSPRRPLPDPPPRRARSQILLGGPLPNPPRRPLPNPPPCFH